jgi:hypothetical protein
MNVKLNKDEVITDFILNFSDCTLSPAEKKSFTEVMANYPSLRKQAVSNWLIRSAIVKMEPIKAGPKFDQKMAAAFALEIEKETREANLKSTSKNEMIS